MLAFEYFSNGSGYLRRNSSHRVFEVFHILYYILNVDLSVLGLATLIILGHT
jgi:hypothetical protein